MEIFWRTISDYNAATWTFQLLLIIIGSILTISLYRDPNEKTKKAMKLFMVFLNLWIAIIYYLVFCSDRNYYYIFAIFWAIVACIWLYDLAKGGYRLERSYKYDKIAFVLYAIPFIYPAVSFARGMSFPSVTSPVMPCTVTIFTLGLLMSFSKKINLFLVLFLFHWALLGISKIYLYKIPEDILLTICTVPAVFLYFKEYISSDICTNSKPGNHAINLILLGTCSVIGIVFSYVIFKSFGYL
ncbi:hypothetical protein EYV94_00105 [Puteibacter caeruleilacunae]|nr:hypothetical protein EYV94_00105 [Puteibacter caeruleilacunae]